MKQRTIHLLLIAALSLLATGALASPPSTTPDSGAWGWADGVEAVVVAVLDMVSSAADTFKSWGQSDVSEMSQGAPSLHEAQDAGADPSCSTTHPNDPACAQEIGGQGEPWG